MLRYFRLVYLLQRRAGFGPVQALRNAYRASLAPLPF